MKNLLIITFLSISLSGCFIIELPSKSSDSISRSSDSISKSSDSIQSLGKSVKSISGSISSIFTSSSKKDKQAKKESYKTDVVETTVLHLSSGLDQESYQYDLARIALKHGITNWQNESYTYIGIGEGMKKAGLDKKDLKKVASDLNKDVTSLLEQGFSLL